MKAKEVRESNALLFVKIYNVELKQLKFQRDTEEDNQKIFFDGQIFDAFSLLIDIIGHAKKKIRLIDGYIDVITLNILLRRTQG